MEQDLLNAIASSSYPPGLRERLKSLARFLYKDPEEYLNVESAATGGFYLDYGTLYCDCGLILKPEDLEDLKNYE
ncbi:hypothetical protein XANCAGTX0491_010019 [Xanthoria calcicola]